MGLYSLLFLFFGILIIGLVYARTGTKTLVHHLLFAFILVLFLAAFFTIHHHFQKTCAILIAANLDQTISLIRSWGMAALTSFFFFARLVGNIAVASAPLPFLQRQVKHTVILYFPSSLCKQRQADSIPADLPSYQTPLL